MSKVNAETIRCGDTIVIPQVQAKVIGVKNADTVIASITDHSVLVFDVEGVSGPFRTFKGQCIAVGTDKLNVVRRVPWYTRWKKMFNKFFYPVPPVVK